MRLLLFFGSDAMRDGGGLIYELFIKYLLNIFKILLHIYLIFGWQVKFQRGSNKKACRQVKNGAGSMKNRAAKKYWRPRLKKKKYGAQTLIMPLRSV